jgi:predicted secreted protein
MDKFGRSQHSNNINHALDKRNLVSMKYFNDKVIVKNKNNIDIENLALKNVGNPSDDTCAINLAYLKRKVLHKKNDVFDAHNIIIRNVKDGITETDVINVKQFASTLQDYVYTFSVCRDVNDEFYSAFNRRIINVASPVLDSDAVNLSFFKQEINKILSKIK